MKKILPIIALIGAGTFIAVGTNNIKTNNEGYINNIKAFKDNLEDYTELNDTKLSKTAFNKYALSVMSEDLESFNESNKNLLPLNENEEALNQDAKTLNSENINNDILSISPEEYDNQNNQENLIEEEITTETSEDEEDETINSISTLYSLSDDISSSCDDFCELKKEITDAIIETQNLITKIQNKELELTTEQKMFISEQSNQLKNLGRQLSNITTELSFQLSDLNQIMSTKDANIDTLNLKYLIVLDNLVNGNEMLQSGLNSLNLINQMFNMRATLPPNNTGRILYGFQQNDNPPVIKDYYIDENGQIVDNTPPNNNEETNEENSNMNNETELVNENKKTNIDTYQNNSLTTNIDTYQNTNLPRNIDSFFNTALLDNEFMYGNGGYGYMGMNGMYNRANPYMQNYGNYERNNTNYTTNNPNNTQHVENEKTAQQENASKKEQKKFKLKKNIDTYKEANDPGIKTKLGAIKNSIDGFFNKFKQNDLKVDLNDKIDNPIYRFESNQKD